jgi:hypothetical protein
MMTLHWKASRSLPAAGLAVILALVGCTADATVLPLTELQFPGVRKIAELAAVQHDGLIGDVATYTDPVSSKTRIVFQADQLYTIGLDGRDLRALNGVLPCFGQLAVAPDGRWVACAVGGGIELVALVPGASHRSVQLLGGGFGDHASSPAWSPDGSVVAVVVNYPDAPTSSPQSGCSVALFQFAAGHLSPHPIATLAFPMFINPKSTQCSLVRVSWSRDGAWLAVVGLEPEDDLHWGVYVLSLASYAALSAASPGSPVAEAVAPADLTRVGEMRNEFDFLRPIAWSTVSGHPVLTYVANDITSNPILQVEPQSGLSTLLLNTTYDDAKGNGFYGEVCGLAWTPDDAHLVFVECGYGNIEVHPTASKLFVYTPPAT